MSDDLRYRIEELATSDWTVLPDNCTNLTREQAKARVDELILEGFNPNRLRVRVET